MYVTLKDDLGLCRLPATLAQTLLLTFVVGSQAVVHTFLGISIQASNRSGAFSTAAFNK